VEFIRNQIQEIWVLEREGGRERRKGLPEREEWTWFGFVFD